MELKVGMYVRTKKGIGRVTEYTKHESWGYIVKVLGQYSCYTHTLNGELSDVIKSGDNLIDLIEVGDYVNGLRINSITEVDENHDVRLVWNLTTYGDDDISFSNEEIKSIVTKEQFESMKYEVK